MAQDLQLYNAALSPNGFAQENCFGTGKLFDIVFTIRGT